MCRGVQRIWALAQIIILDGLRRHALLGLLLLSLAAEAGGLLFFDFIPRDVGRASADFIFSVIWLSGMLYIYFFAVQTIAWDEEQRTIYSLLARPISRSEYVIGVFTGNATLLFLLNVLLGILGILTLMLIKRSVLPVYFPNLSVFFYLSSWLGLFAMELMLLSAVTLFSGLVRGGFPVFLMSLSFYAICSGLPVVREAVAFSEKAGAGSPELSSFVKGMTAIFPDFDRLDYKNFIVTASASTPNVMEMLTNFGLVTTYIAFMLFLACAVYKRRDLV